MSTEQRISALEQEITGLKVRLSVSRNAHMDIEQAAAYLGLSVSYMYKLRMEGNGPAPHTGPHQYRIPDLDAWDDKRKGLTPADLLIIRSLETKKRSK